MIYCPECGGIIEKGAIFCGHCGNSLFSEESQSAAGEQGVLEENRAVQQTEILMDKGEVSFEKNPSAPKTENDLPVAQTPASVKSENQFSQISGSAGLEAEILPENDAAHKTEQENNQLAQDKSTSAETENNFAAPDENILAAPSAPPESAEPEKNETAAERVDSAIDAPTSAPKLFEAGETPHEAIKIPQNPVGSSMYDSIEPTFVSVQIFEPTAPPAEQQQANSGLEAENKKSEDTVDHNSPKIEARASEPAKNSAPTSPNIGGSDTGGRAKAKLKPLDEGTVLNNRYEIIRRIGGGGMGAVYLASDRNLGGVLRAVKEMVQSYIEDAQQEKAVNDFRRESLLLTSLEHPSIPTIFDYFYDEKECRFYLVMKYISGGDLSGRLRSSPEGRIDERSVTEWAIQIADVLDYLHNRQPPIVYRDLKPSNIMIDGNNGRVMLIDFGIARWVNKEEKGVTAVGTMGYAPPELFSGNVEPRSDIYSLGSTMFHLLTGADPQSNPLLIFDFQKNPRPRQINPQLTDGMEQILMKAVEYSSEKRFASAAEMRDILTGHLASLRAGQVSYGIAEQPKTGKSALNQPVFCGFCGQKVLAADAFCPFCGAQQPLAGQRAKSAPPTADHAPPKATARLTVAGTSELDAPVFDLEKEQNLVGRRDPMSNIFPEIDLSKFDPQTKISRRHARIWREKGVFMLEDLGSSNGTVLISRTKQPEKLVKNQPRVLAHGDKIRVGDTTLNFVVG